MRPGRCPFQGGEAGRGSGRSLAGRPGASALRLVCRLLLVLLPVLAGPGLGAQGQPEPPAAGPARPRIGLVLGGGGAKGAAHVGVLKVMEELRIPVDDIAGTSMGSIVGAAYASGYTSGQIRDMITDVDWKEMVRSAPRPEVPYQRKKLDALFSLGPEFGVKQGRLVLPSGAISTHQIESLLRRIASGSGPDAVFDRLPIPFRAVATDLESGDMKVFDRGDLAVAMRASMAVPGAFAPVDVGGRLYADGMLVRNLPVDVARAMGADVIIAVQVGNPPRTRDQLGGLMAVTGQALDIAITANERAQLATLTPRDVAVQVVLKDITSGDFNRMAEAIGIGEATARTRLAALSRYSLTEEQYARWRAGIRRPAAIAHPVIDEVRIEGLKVTNPEVMRTYVRSRPGEAYDPAKADQDATRLVARGDFAAVGQDLEEKDGKSILAFTGKEKPWGPNYLTFDLNMSTDMKGDTAWGIRASLQQRWLNHLGGELRTSVQLGRPNAVNSEFYQPLDLAQRFFLAPSFTWVQDLARLFNGDSQVAEVNNRWYYGRLDAGTAFGNWGEARVGLLRGSEDTSQVVGDPGDVTLGRHPKAAVTAKVAFDTLDRALFPTSGLYGSINGTFSRTSLGADADYELLSGHAGYAWPHDRNVWMASLDAGTSFNSRPDYSDQFKVGGLGSFSGYQIDQIICQEYRLGKIGYRRRFADLSELAGTGVYAGISLEAGQVSKRLYGAPDTGTILGGLVLLGVDSAIGPVCLAYGQSEGGHTAIYLYIGSSFDLFRP